jgi:hypothetical protein
MIIKGDNLMALKSLWQTPSSASSVILAFPQGLLSIQNNLSAHSIISPLYHIIP